jgi:hypothetical protein
MRQGQISGVSNNKGQLGMAVDSGRGREYAAAEDLARDRDQFGCRTTRYVILFASDPAARHRAGSVRRLKAQLNRVEHGQAPTACVAGGPVGNLGSVK